LYRSTKMLGLSAVFNEFGAFMIHLYSFTAFWLSSKINELPPFRDTSLLSKDKNIVDMAVCIKLINISCPMISDG
jgi:hypothetical protein